MSRLTVATALTVALAASAATAMAQEPAAAAETPQVSLAGKWNVSTQTDQGTMSSVMDLQHEGEKVTGSLASEMGTNPIAGEYKEGTLAFAINMDTANGALELWFSGALQEDGTLAGTIDFGQGTIPWTAKRVPAPSVAGRWSLSIDSPQGAMAATLDLKVEGTDVTGTITSDMGTAEAYGTYTEGTLEFAIWMGDNTNGIEIWFTGTMGEDGATMSGTLDAGQGPTPWTAKKAN